jgi:hypothetical protein
MPPQSKDFGIWIACHCPSLLLHFVTDTSCLLEEYQGLSGATIHQYWFCTLAYRYSRITSIKSPSFCMTTFSESHIPYSPPASVTTQQANTGISTSPIAETYLNTTSRTLQTWGFSPCSLKLLAPDDGDFVKLIFLCGWTVNLWTCPTLFCS